ncbi:MAG: MATE family efflux transporter [Saccharofermentans sp.]|nr:MATE family efflux transporter [Saccharofermentans sp.]
MTDTNKQNSFYNKLLQLAIPATIQSLMLALVAVADALMLGSIEQNAMSAVTLATQVQFIQNMILGGVVATAAILGAQYYGKGDKATLTKIFHICLKLGGFISIAFFILCEFFPASLMHILTDEQVLVDIGVKYLKISAFSYLITGISQSYLTMMKVSGHQRFTATVSSSAVVVNIILNAVFIFGKSMSVEGAALATAITRVIELTACVILSYRSTFIRPDFKKFFESTPLLFKDYCKVMLPILGACLVWGVGFASYTAFMGHMGTDAAAANSVVAVVRDLVCCITDGMAVGGGILIGNELGAGKLDVARKYGDRIVIIAFVIGAASSIIMLAVTPLIVHFVKLTPEAVTTLYGLMVVMGVYMIGRAVNTIMINGIFSAGGDTMYDLYSLAVTMWCLAVPLAALGTFVFSWSPVIVYACTCLDEVGKIPWTLFHYKRYKWLKDLTR